MCGFCNTWMSLCVTFVTCVCVYVCVCVFFCVLYCVVVCMCELLEVCFWVRVGFVMCGCFDNCFGKNEMSWACGSYGGGEGGV